MFIPTIYSIAADPIPRFRWVALQLAELEKCSSTNEITERLAELPKGLDEIYSRTLKKIDEKHRADTKTFLQWLAFSKRPMKIAEIAETVTVDFASEDDPVFRSTRRYFDPRDVLVRCSSLISESDGVHCWLNPAFQCLLTVKIGTIKLSHFSVKEYLISERIEKIFSISERASHSKIAEVSLAYLLQFHSFEPLTKAMLDSSPLALYAAEHWVNHAKSGGMGSVVLKLILQLFTSETAPLTNWIRMWNIDIGSSWHRKDFGMNKDRVLSPLYYASLAGMEDVSYVLLERGGNANAEGGYYGNALQAASHRGYEAIVELLLKRGARANAKGGKYMNALQAASCECHEPIVKLLLENGADVNAEGGEYGNALQAASYKGHEPIMKLLLENGADVNAEGGELRNALQAASDGGYEPIVKLLLETGADVNAKGGFYGSALQAASCNGHKPIVKLLLENGADVDAEGGEYGNALQAASYPRYISQQSADWSLTRYLFFVHYSLIPRKSNFAWRFMRIGQKKHLRDIRE